MNRTERLLDLIAYLLNSPEPVSWQEIKNHFPEDYARGVEESNQRKFERDKAELISLGIPIDYRNGAEVKKEGYTIEKEKLFLPEVEFLPSESSLLMLSSSAVLENESFPYRDQLESALHKIASVHKPIQPPPPELRITFSAETRKAPRWIPEVQDALERRKWTQIVYHAFSTGRTETRKVNPYGLIFRNRNWTVVGWDHLREDIRSFVVTRIQDLFVNPRRPGTIDYQIPEDFSLRRYRNLQPWEFASHEAMDVTVRVSGHRLQELRPQLSQAEEPTPGTFRLKVSNREGLLSWVLSQRTDVQVLEPSEIKDELRRAVRDLI